jgi:fumarylacetoacetase
VSAAIIDETHDPQRRSWVEAANAGSEFPIQNLPLGVFSPAGGEPRGGVAIGDRILDLSTAAASGLLSGEAALAAQAASGPQLNALLALGAGPRRALRRRLSEVLSVGAAERPTVEAWLHPAADCSLHLPCVIGDYTDFFAGIHHATNAGRLFRPDNPLLPNYKHVPVAYHSRASSIRISGEPVRRPSGQRKPPEAEAPIFSASRRLDMELELGIWIGQGNELGEPIPIAEASHQIAGLSLLNDWSARDLQAWEYVPLGPFLAKNFLTTISPWIVTAEALAPFRIAQPPRPEGDPAPLPYLTDEADQATGAYALELDVLFSTEKMRQAGLPPHRLSTSAAQHLYWTAAQMVAHHTVGGCNLRPGDLLGTGTISGPDETSMGSLLELSLGGKKPFSLPSGETRSFLEDGDELAIVGRAKAEGWVTLGFGPCVGRIMPARPN